MLGKLDYKIAGLAILFLVFWMGYSPGNAVVWSDETPIRTDISVHVANGMIINNTGYPDLLILDVREQWEYNISHLNDALLIPLGELESRLDEIESYNETEIIVYCRTGVRSQEGSDILVASNFTKVFNMLGGITAWIEAGYDYWLYEEVPTAPSDIDPLIIGAISGVGVMVVIILILFIVRIR